MNSNGVAVIDACASAGTGGPVPIGESVESWQLSTGKRPGLKTTAFVTICRKVGINEDVLSMSATTRSSNLPQRDHALELLADRGMVRLREFLEVGIARETVSRLVREGRIVRLTRGLYQLPDAELDVHHNLAEVAKLVPKGVICLLSATQFHGLTVHTPSAVWLAIERSARTPRIDYPPVRIVRVGGAAFSMGVAEHEIEGVSVRIYDPAKTVVDCFRFRTRVGLDVALEALRECLRQRRCTADAIYHQARAARAWNVMRPYMEGILADGV